MDVLERLEQAGAVYTDRHFVYVSGKHGPGYINADMVFPDLYLMLGLCHGLGKPFRENEIDVVVGPATGGIPLAYLTAFSLGGSNPALAPAVAWADKVGEGFAFERAGFVDHVKNGQALVVEDLLTTGGSVEKVCRAVEEAGGTVVGVSVIVNRGGVTAEDLGVPRLEALANVNFAALAVDELGHCELCRQSVPIVENIGHGADYKAAHPDYEGGYITLSH